MEHVGLRTHHTDTYYHCCCSGKDETYLTATLVNSIGTYYHDDYDSDQHKYYEDFSHGAYFQQWSEQLLRKFDGISVNNYSYSP